MYMQSAESYDNYAQYGYNSKIDGGAKNYYGAARRSGISGQWLYRYTFSLLIASDIHAGLSRYAVILGVLFLCFLHIHGNSLL
jgi:hypothetical protein